MSNGGQARSSSSSHFVAGLGSGILSAVLLQPIDLLKTRVQQQRQQSNPLRSSTTTASSSSSSSSSLLTTVREIARGPQALRSFWRGTLPSTLRTGFGSALYFTGLNLLRQNVARSDALRAAGAVQQQQQQTSRGSQPSSSSLPKLSNLANLTTGAIARACAGMVLMPMTVMKVRYESNLYAYGSMASASRDILKKEGLRGFFVGFGATAVRDAPYAGLYVLFYEQSKRWLSALSSGVVSSGPDGGAGGRAAGSGTGSGTGGGTGTGSAAASLKLSTSTSINFASGVFAAGLATALTNPFDSVKTRIQLRPREYRNMAQAARKLLRDEGAKSLFDGLALRMARKCMSSALAWTLYEEMIRRAELTMSTGAANEEARH